MASTHGLHGRQYEQRELDILYGSQQAEFLAIYGRRRVGKTHLVHQYFHDKGIYFEVTGIHKAALATQLDNFATVFSDVFLRGQKKPLVNHWFEAFTLLAIIIMLIT